MARRRSPTTWTEPLLRGTMQIALDKLESVLGQLPVWILEDGPETLMGVRRERALEILLEEIRNRPLVLSLINGDSYRVLEELVGDQDEDDVDVEPVFGRSRSGELVKEVADPPAQRSRGGDSVV